MNVTLSPLIAIVGETASGKSALALELAERLGGEIIAADSRTIYKGMDIGTAKPTAEDRARVPHHLLDVVEPDERFTVADFKRLAEQAISDISGRGKLPIMVGGTGFYIDSILFDYQFPDPPIKGSGVNRTAMRKNTVVLGSSVPRDELKKRISSRVEKMIEQGLTDEIKDLAGSFGWEAAALKTPGYRAFREYLEGSISLDETKQRIIKNDLDLAKRQRTWFKRNNSIHWLTAPVSLAETVALITTELDK